MTIDLPPVSVTPQAFGGFSQPITDPTLPPQRILAIISFVTGLVSFLLGWTIVIPLAGFIFGTVALKKEPSGRRFAIAGIVLNLINIVLGIVIILAIIAATLFLNFLGDFFTEWIAPIL